MNKRGQFWYLDFIIGLMIVTLISVFFITLAREISITQYGTNELINAGVDLSNNLMSEGKLDMESTWINEKGRIGVLTSNKIDKNKLNALKLLTSTDDGYKISKYLLGIQEDYMMYLEYIYMDPKLDPQDPSAKIIVRGPTPENPTYYGKPNTDPDTLEHQTIRITRYAFYDPTNDGQINGQIVRMVIAVWKE